MVTTVRIVLRVPAGNDRGPQYMDQVLAAIHQANPRRLPIHLDVCRIDGQVTLSCRFPDELRTIVESQLFAQYPECDIRWIRDESLEPDPSHQTWERELHLHHGLFPIRRYAQFEDALNRVSADPLTAIFMSLQGGRNPGSLDARITLTVFPASRAWRRRAERCLRRLSGPFFRRHHRIAHFYSSWALSHHFWLRVVAWFLGRLERSPGEHSASITTSPSRQHDREEELQAAADKVGRLLFQAHLRLRVIGRPEDAVMAKRKLDEMTGAFGQFSSPRLASFHTAKSRFGGGTFLLSTEELATIWHLPTATVRAPTMTTVESRELAPPVQLPTRARDPDLAVLAVTAYRGRHERFGILPEDRRRHMAVIGKTGMGKTTLLQQLINSDIRAGRGVALLDPHGDLCDAVLAAVPRERTNDVILFDAADTTHPLSFNILACPRPEQRALVASGLVTVLKKIYGEFWGPRMGYILLNALLALLEVPGSTMLSVLRILNDAKFRQPLVAKLRDPVVRDFWQKDFAVKPLKLQQESISPIQNKIGHFVSSPLLRNILGQSRNSLDLRQVMDDGKILLVNLSKGKLGDDVSALLGSFLVTALQLAAMSRADVPESERTDFFLYIDEFQNFATDSFATILSEARKYRLALTLANQYLAQLDEETAAAVFGNVGTLVSFQVGADDAERLATQFAGVLKIEDLLRLPRYQAYIRLLIDGTPSQPFSMRTLPPTRALDPERPTIIRRVSRHRYARPAVEVEQQIAAALDR